jgi:transcriptional regulator with XRE-family HTH domain
VSRVNAEIKRGSRRDSQPERGGARLDLVDVKTEIREFLTSRRGNVTPEQAGLTVYGPRRVPGLRRAEVATLAGVSVEYYTRIERGNLSGVSDVVLESLVRALQLDDAERSHLYDLARACRPTAPMRRRRATKPQLRPNVQWVLDSITGAAAFVSNGSHDVIAANRLGEALWSPLYAKVDRPVNSARYLFLDHEAQDMYPDWERIADETVAIMRHTAGVDPRDRRLSELVGELSMQSQEFRTRWASHDVRFHNSGTKRLLHPVVGELTLNFERFDIATDSGLTMFTYTAEPGSRSAESLSLLASWAATPDAPHPEYG